MKVGVYLGSVLSPLLFIIVLEALSREFRIRGPWEDLYANDLVIIAESRPYKKHKDEAHDLWYGPGPPAEFRRVSMRRLSRLSGLQIHLLQRLQALGAQEMQWAQSLDKRTLITAVHGAAQPLDGRPQREVQ